MDTYFTHLDEFLPVHGIIQIPCKTDFRSSPASLQFSTQSKYADLEEKIALVVLFLSAVLLTVRFHEAVKSLLWFKVHCRSFRL